MKTTFNADIYRQSEVDDLVKELRKPICVSKIYNSKIQYISMTSGFFNPLHVGHVRLLGELRLHPMYFGRTVVVVNGDGAVRRKHNYSFMCVEERMEIIAGIAGVDYVIDFDTDTMVEALLRIKPDYFLKGGDVTITNMNDQEMVACEQISCKIIYGVGGEKIASSSELIRKCKNGYII